MKKLLWAAGLALPLLALSQQKVQAQGHVFMAQVNCCRIKVCLPSCPKCCEINTYCFGCCNGADYDACHGVVPGPWYSYWPSGDGTTMTGAVYPYWMYDDHFQVSAPIYPYWPGSAAPVAATGAEVSAGQNLSSNFQPAGFYPSYWYGR